MTIQTFDDLALSALTLEALTKMGFQTPSPIQSESIPKLLEGHDLIGQAQTGTGKTAAFGIPIVEKLDFSRNEVQALVICPTRELTMQVADELRKILQTRKKARVTAVFGGASIQNQIADLKKGVHIVVGTPGRLLDHLDRGTLKLENAGHVVLDEADEMLDMGFRDDIESILSETPENRQTVFFSATMPKPILELTKKYQKNPITIKVTPKELTMTTIEQRYLQVKKEDKVKVLERLVDFYEPKLCLIFSNTKRMADELVAELQKDGFYAEALHGDMRQAQRTQVMNQFRAGVIQLLVATDVAARGLDVEGVEMVINFDVPQDTEYYVHRIGRTGRAGRKGVAYSLVSRREMMMIRDIERFANTTIAKGEIPSLKHIEDRKKGRFLAKILAAAAEPEMQEYLSWVEELETAGLTPAQAAATLIKMEIHHQLTGGSTEVEELQQETHFDKGRKGAAPSSPSSKEQLFGPKSKRGHKGARQEGYKRLFINLGKKSGIRPHDIVGAIAGETGLPGKSIGSIDIYDKFTFVDIPGDQLPMVIKKMQQATIKGFKLHVKEADEK